MKQLILIGGGSRGLGASIKNQYLSNDYLVSLFHRNTSYEDLISEKSHLFDLDNKIAWTKFNSDISEIVQKQEDGILSTHVLTGGSLGVDFGSASIEEINNIFLHNAILPIYSGQLIYQLALSKPNIQFEYFLYSSAVTQNLTSSPFYSSAKSSLESFYKSFVIQAPSNLFSCMLRLGPVNINHKYFHKLSKSDPKRFNNILRETVPTGHFIEPKEVASFIMQTSQHKGMYNGMLCDLTGGSSWI